MIPDLSVLVVIALLLTCVYLLNGLILQPVLLVLERREHAVTSARELAESASIKATAAAEEYTRKLSAARAEVYQQMDETRRVALDRRAATLAATRADVERELDTARERVGEQSAQARALLDREAGELAGVVVQRVLGRAS